MSKTRMVIINDEKVFYQLIQSRRKTTVMQYDFDSDIIVVKTSYFANLQKVDAFVVKNYHRFMQKIKIQQNNHNKYYQGSSDTYFYLFNKCLEIVRHNSNKNYVKVDNDKLHIYKKANADEKKIVDGFIKKKISEAYDEALSTYRSFLEDHQLVAPPLRIRFMKTRWGSCNYQKAVICLNAYLIHYDYRFFQAVVIHELVHLKIANHSKSFYQLLLNYEPNYKQMINLIKKEDIND